MPAYRPNAQHDRFVRSNGTLFVQIPKQLPIQGWLIAGIMDQCFAHESYRGNKIVAQLRGRTQA
jgi:hypothetical protein